MECHQVRLSILISNVLFSECFLGVAWLLFSKKKKKKKKKKNTERKSYMPEIKLIQSHTRVTLENCKNISSASRKFKMDRKRIREYLKQEEKIVNQKCRSNQMTEVVLRGFH